jgi:hypothetical protein
MITDEYARVVINRIGGIEVAEQRVIDALQRHGPMKWDDIANLFPADLVRVPRAVISSLEAKGRVQSRRDTWTGGGPRTVWSLVT